MMKYTAEELDRRRRETAEARAAMTTKFAQYVSGRQSLTTAIPWLSLHSHVAPTSPMSRIYELGVAVILQGRKQVVVGDEQFIFDEARFLLTTIDLPVVSAVLDASKDRPYAGMLVKLDLAKIRQMILEYEIPAPSNTPVRGLAIGLVTHDLLDALGRLLDLLDAPRHMPVKSDLILKEIIYELLTSEQGGRLWQMAMTGSQSNRMHKVISWLRQHYAEPLRAEELAEMAAMSVSSMQHRFRDLTSLSPLQFQKRLRLEEARRLMLVENLDAGMAAVRVGYESQSQFSREYARMFGQPPMRDIKQLRAVTQTASEQLEPA
jgi:AraC-like DNA-binding protein